MLIMNVSRLTGIPHVYSVYTLNPIAAVFSSRFGDPFASMIYRIQQCIGASDDQLLRSLDDKFLLQSFSD